MRHFTGWDGVGSAVALPHDPPSGAERAWHEDDASPSLYRYRPGAGICLTTATTINSHDLYKITYSKASVCHSVSPFCRLKPSMIESGTAANVVDGEG
jgi:hypothetical protein